MQDATEWKTKGNRAFAKGRIAEAISCYSSGIAAADSAEDSALKAALLSNRAMCHLKQEEYQATIQDCYTALDLLKTNSKTDQMQILRVKLWFRRAKAWLKMGAPENLEETEFDLEAILKEDPDNKDSKKLVKEVRAQQYKNSDRKPAAVVAGPQRMWQCCECVAQPKFASYDEFAAHRGECQTQLGNLLQDLQRAGAENRGSHEPETLREIDDADFYDSSNDDNFDIKNCRICNKTPEEAGKNTMKVCSVCKSVSYCRREHQLEDWYVQKHQIGLVLLYFACSYSLPFSSIGQSIARIANFWRTIESACWKSTKTTKIRCATRDFTNWLQHKRPRV